MTSVYTLSKSVRNKRWAQAPLDHNLAVFIKNKTGLPYSLAEILARRNTLPDEVEPFLNPKLKHCMPNPNVLKDMEQAVNVVLDAIQTNKQITVFGDYDVDGATSVALITRMLLALGHNKINSYIPDRITEGYGLNIEAVKFLKNAGTDLLIAVDCGSSAHGPITEADHLGMQTVILDHHLCVEKIAVESAVIINPNKVDDSSGLGYLAAVGVCFMFVVALVNRMIETGLANEKKMPNAMMFLDLVALGTVCDVVPLQGLNRVLVKHGLKLIEARANIGIKALLDSAGVNLQTSIDSYHLGFVLGPRINAGGRVGQADLGSKLLMSDDYMACREMAIKLHLYNHERRALESMILEEALAGAPIGKDVPVAIVYGGNWHQGVIGIVAERLKEKLGRPTIVVTDDKGGVCKASCRSIRGIDIGQAILQAKNNGILITGGGHEMAAGFTIHKDNIVSLQAFLTEKLYSKYKELTASMIHYYDSEISLESVTSELAKEINKVGPFGNGNEVPMFMLSNVAVVNAKILKGEHIFCILKDIANPTSRKTIKGMCFRGVQNPLGEILLSRKHPMSLIVNISLNKWQGQENVELVIHDAILKSLSASTDNTEKK